jgi:YbbR domain-containing protein
LYSGSTRELFKLYGSPPRIVKSIPDTMSGFAFTLDLSAADLITDPAANVLAVEVQPQLIQVVLDDAVERNVPVISRVTVTADSGFVLVGQVRIIPESVTVRGPSVYVQRVASLPTDAIAISDLRAGTRQTITLDTTGLGVVRIVPSEVEVVADVAEIATRLVIGVPVDVRSDRPGSWVTDPPAVAVTVRGIATRLQALTRDSLHASVTISGATDEQSAAVLVTPPTGLTATATPDTVIVKRPGG